MFSRNPVLRLVVMLALVLGAMFTEASPVAAETGPCEDIYADNGWNGNTIRSVAANPWSYRWVKADINPLGGTFIPCSGPGGGDPFSHDGPSAWVSVEPHLTNYGGSGGSSIIQIGILNCNSDANNTPPYGTPCSGTSPHYFWAYGGCAGYEPKPRDLGVADYATHEYMITYSTSGEMFYLYIDGVWKAQISANASSVSCWASPTDDVEVGIFGEFWDGGDSYADATNKLNFTDIRFKSESDGFGVWNLPCDNCGPNTVYWTTSTTCDISNNSGPIASVDHKCDIVNNDSFDLWSVDE